MEVFARVYPALVLGMIQQDKHVAVHRSRKPGGVHCFNGNVYEAISVFSSPLLMALHVG